MYLQWGGEVRALPPPWRGTPVCVDPRVCPPPCPGKAKALGSGRVVADAGGGGTGGTPPTVGVQGAAVRLVTPPRPAPHDHCRACERLRGSLLPGDGGTRVGGWHLGLPPKPNPKWVRCCGAGGRVRGGVQRQPAPPASGPGESQEEDLGGASSVPPPFLSSIVHIWGGGHLYLPPPRSVQARCQLCVLGWGGHVEGRVHLGRGEA